MVIYVSHSETVRAQDIETMGPLLQWLGHTIRLGGGAVLTYGTIAMILTALIIWYVLNRTAFGRHVYATGDDDEAARLAGINTRGVYIAVYTIAGFIRAVASWALIGCIGAASPLGNQTANLDAIAAVKSSAAHRCSKAAAQFVGTLFGALIVGVFCIGLALAGVDLALAGIRWSASSSSSLSRSTSGSGRFRHEYTAHPSGPNPSSEGPQQALWQGGGSRQCGFRPDARRNPCGHRRQRCRKIDPGQGAVRGGDTRFRHDRTRRQGGQFPLADRGAHGGDRDGLPEPGAVAGAHHRRQSVSWTGNPQTRLRRGNVGCACSTGRRCKGKPAKSFPNLA